MFIFFSVGELHEKVEFWRHVKIATIPMLGKTLLQLHQANETIKYTRRNLKYAVGVTYICYFLVIFITYYVSDCASVLTGAIAAVCVMIAWQVEKSVIIKCQMSIEEIKKENDLIKGRIREYIGTPLLLLVNRIDKIQLEYREYTHTEEYVVLQAIYRVFTDREGDILSNAIGCISAFSTCLIVELVKVRITF